MTQWKQNIRPLENTDFQTLISQTLCTECSSPMVHFRRIFCFKKVLGDNLGHPLIQTTGAEKSCVHDYIVTFPIDSKADV